MASTAYKDTGAFLTVGGQTFHMDAYVNYDSATRSDNTVSIVGANGVFKITDGGGGFFSGYDVTGAYQFPTNTTRRTQSFGTGGRTSGDVLSGAENNFSISVGANDTSVNVRAGASYAGDPISWTSSSAITIPALGAPAGTTTIDAGSTIDTELGVRNNVTSWGSNATAGSVRSYIADNSGFTGQTYKSTTDNALIVHTGLTPNKKYWFRGWADNGGGKSTYFSATTGVTMANTVESSKDIQATTAVFNAATTQGEYTTTTEVQYRKVGDTGTWSTSDVQSGGTPVMSVSGLLPGTDYDYYYVVRTSAGNWITPQSTFTTLPAAKLVMPDGTAKNAIPRVIHSDGSIEMVNIIMVE
jgi:hypothetical protein